MRWVQKTGFLHPKQWERIHPALFPMGYVYHGTNPGGSLDGGNMDALISILENGLRPSSSHDNPYRTDHDYLVSRPGAVYLGSQEAAERYTRDPWFGRTYPQFKIRCESLRPSLITADEDVVVRPDLGGVGASADRTLFYEGINPKNIPRNPDDHQQAHYDMTYRGLNSEYQSILAMLKMGESLPNDENFVPTMWDKFPREIEILLYGTRMDNWTKNLVLRLLRDRERDMRHRGVVGETSSSGDWSNAMGREWDRGSVTESALRSTETFAYKGFIPARDLIINDRYIYHVAASGKESAISALADLLDRFPDAVPDEINLETFFAMAYPPSPRTVDGVLQKLLAELRYLSSDAFPLEDRYEVAIISAFQAEGVYYIFPQGVFNEVEDEAIDLYLEGRDEELLELVQKSAEKGAHPNWEISLDIA